MKFFIGALLVLASTASAFSQADTVKPGEIRFRSQFQTSEGGSRVLRGRVSIETTNVTIRADRAIYNPQTGDIQASGNVHISLKK